MQKITHYCDGCGKKLEGERLKAARESTLAYNSITGEAPKNEIFCPEQCEEWSRDYWRESGPIALKALTDAAAAINNHRRKFFSARLSNLKEVV